MATFKKVLASVFGGFLLPFGGALSSGANVKASLLAGAGGVATTLSALFVTSPSDHGIVNKMQ